MDPARGPWEVSINEALACGIPVVTSDAVGSTYELVLPGNFGYTYRHGDAGDLAARIVAVLRDPEMQRRVRETGFKSLEPWDYPATAEIVQAVRYA